MTPTRLREILAILHWSQRGLADILQMHDRQVRRWATGAAIPVHVAEWLEVLAVLHEANPPPRRVAGTIPTSTLTGDAA